MWIAKKLFIMYSSFSIIGGSEETVVVGEYRPSELERFELLAGE